MDAFAALGSCSLALEDLRSGRLHVLTVKWPSDCHGARGTTDPSDEDSFLVRHPDAYGEALRLAERIDARVMLYQCEIVDAATWQQRELDAKGHAVGPCGGMLRIR